MTPSAEIIRTNLPLYYCAYFGLKNQYKIELNTVTKNYSHSL